MVAPAGGYRRDATTWAAFGGLFAFGFLNALLGPALPYLRAVEHVSYLTVALHQATFAIGGGVAGLLATRERPAIGRAAIIAGGLCGAGFAGLLIGYAGTPVLTITGAFLVSLLATSALIRVWAVLADVHARHRAVAMTEGEVAVSLAGIVTPLLIGGLADTVLSWRFAFVIGTAVAALAALAVWRAPTPPSAQSGATAVRIRPEPTLIVVFAIVALEFSLSFWLASYLSDDVGMSRGAAAAAVSGLYAANLGGRLLASRLARRAAPERLLAAALATALVGTPLLLAASAAPLALTGMVTAGVGIGAMFPLTSALHVKASPIGADQALGQVLTVASSGQLAGPLLAGAIAQAVDLRTGLIILPALVLLAAAGLRSA